MVAQKRSSNRNYIDLVEDESDERRVAELPISVRPVAAMRAARGEAR